MHGNSRIVAALSAVVAAVLPLRAAALCTAANPNSTSVAESTPTSAFVNNNDGTVTHIPTGLMWKLCAQGTSGAGCAGTATAMNWRTALTAAVNDATAGHSDWRVPNSKELGSIAEHCGYGPAINRNVFPAASPTRFWTGTTFRSNPIFALTIDFNDGVTGAFNKANTANLRLVRGGQAFDSFDARALRQAVVEYLNTADFPESPGGHFFYSSDTAEQAAVDAGAAGAFARTGREFLIGGTSPVCRFYGSVSPGPNSHFFTVDVGECNALKAAQIVPTPAAVQQWNYEGISYNTTPATVAANGARSCPANTLPLYRAYNNAFPASGPKNPWDSNHRFTPQLSDIAELVGIGWRDEGIVFCTAP